MLGREAPRQLLRQIKFGIVDPRGIEPLSPRLAKLRRSRPDVPKKLGGPMWT